MADQKPSTSWKNATNPTTRNPSIQPMKEHKSILKHLHKSNSRAGSRSTLTPPTLSSLAKKKVSIASPPQSAQVKVDEDITLTTLLKETPLPRVALMATSSTQSKRKASKTKHSIKKSVSKRTVSSSSAKKSSKPKTATKKVKSKRKLKKKSASVSQIEVPSSSSRTSADGTDPGRQYVKELGTINQLLRSVTDKNTHVGHETEIIDGYARPFSTGELQQLIKSIGRVASIHQRIPPGGSEIASKVVEGIKKIKLKEKTNSTSITDKKTSPPSTSTIVDFSKLLEKVASAKSIYSQKTYKPASASPSKSSIGSKKPVSSATSKEKSNGNLKAVKSAVKALYKSQKTKSKSRKRRSQKKSMPKSSDSLLSELSELDLVKSALLNKKYYEESMALEKYGPNYEMVTGRSSIKKRSKSVGSKRDSSRNHGLEYNLSPISSLIATGNVMKLKESGYNAQKALTGLRNLEETLEHISGKSDNESLKTPGDAVLINYSHVIRGPQNLGKSSLQNTKVSNRLGYSNPRPLPYKRDVTLDEVNGFDEHLQRVKYIGTVPLTQRNGILDIAPAYIRRERDGSDATGGKYLKNDKILEATRSKAETGSTKSIIVKDHKKAVDEFRNTAEKKETNKSIASVPSQNKEQQREHRSTSRERKKTPSKANNQSQIDGMFSTAYKKSLPYPTTVFEVKNPSLAEVAVGEPLITNIARAPSNWTDNSITSSIENILGGSGWSVLNKQTAQKTKEINSRIAGKVVNAPNDDMDDIRRGLDDSDERKKYLTNLIKTREEFDTYKVFNTARDRLERKDPPTKFGGNNHGLKASSNDYDRRSTMRGTKHAV